MVVSSAKLATNTHSAIRGLFRGNWYLTLISPLPMVEAVALI